MNHQNKATGEETSLPARRRHTIGDRQRHRTWMPTNENDDQRNNMSREAKNASEKTTNDAKVHNRMEINSQRQYNVMQRAGHVHGKVKGKKDKPDMQVRNDRLGKRRHVWTSENECNANMRRTSGEASVT